MSMVNRNEDPLTLNTILAASALTGYRIPYILSQTSFRSGPIQECSWICGAFLLLVCWPVAMVNYQHGALHLYDCMTILSHLPCIRLQCILILWVCMILRTHELVRIFQMSSTQKRTHDRFEERVQPYLHVSQGILHLRYL